MTDTRTGTDIIELLEADHRRAEALLARFDTTPVTGRDGYFAEVVHELVRHEVAEEVVVYPAIRKDAPNGDEEADARIAEQSEAEHLLADMEHLDRQSPEFAARFEQLRAAVLAHAGAEEEHVFPLLRGAEDAAARAELGARYEKAKDRAPTHPHPAAPDTPPGNKLLGPVAALFDRARDATGNDR